MMTYKVSDTGSPGRVVEIEAWDAPGAIRAYVEAEHIERPEHPASRCEAPPMVEVTAVHWRCPTDSSTRRIRMPWKKAC